MLWRKAGWPLCLCRHSSEQNSVCDLGFAAIQTELGRRALPIAVQLHCDWKPGLASVAKKHFKTVMQDCEHMCTNMRKKATPKASPPERMKWVKKLLSAAATLPTSTMLHVVLERSLERMDEVWECQKFSKYMARRYLCVAFSLMLKSMEWTGCDPPDFGTAAIRLVKQDTLRRNSSLRPATHNSSEGNGKSRYSSILNGNGKGNGKSRYSSI